MKLQDRADSWRVGDIRECRAGSLPRRRSPVRTRCSAPIGPGSQALTACGPGVSLLDAQGEGCGFTSSAELSRFPELFKTEFRCSIQVCGTGQSCVSRAGRYRLNVGESRIRVLDANI